MTMHGLVNIRDNIYYELEYSKIVDVEELLALRVFKVDREYQQVMWYNTVTRRWLCT